MKKWFACLAVAGLLFSAGVGVSHAESWYALETDQTGRTGYIDNDSVNKNDAQATLRLKIVDPTYLRANIYLYQPASKYFRNIQSLQN